MHAWKCATLIMLSSSGPSSSPNLSGSRKRVSICSSCLGNLMQQSISVYVQHIEDLTGSSGIWIVQPFLSKCKYLLLMDFLVITKIRLPGSLTSGHPRHWKASVTFLSKPLRRLPCPSLDKLRWDWAFPLGQKSKEV